MAFLKPVWLDSRVISSARLTEWALVSTPCTLGDESGKCSRLSYSVSQVREDYSGAVGALPLPGTILAF